MSLNKQQPLDCLQDSTLTRKGGSQHGHWVLADGVCDATDSGRNGGPRVQSFSGRTGLLSCGCGWR